MEMLFSALFFEILGWLVTTGMDSRLLLETETGVLVVSGSTTGMLFLETAALAGETEPLEAADVFFDFVVSERKQYGI